jgi:hypothetical protein
MLWHGQEGIVGVNYRTILSSERVPHIKIPAIVRPKKNLVMCYRLEPDTKQTGRLTVGHKLTSTSTSAPEPTAMKLLCVQHGISLWGMYVQDANVFAICWLLAQVIDLWSKQNNSTVSLYITVWPGATRIQVARGVQPQFSQCQWSVYFYSMKMEATRYPLPPQNTDLPI